MIKRLRFFRKKPTGSGLGHVALLAALTAGIFLLMSFLRPQSFPTARNFISMAYQLPELGIFSLAIVFSLVTAGIDLSVVSTANLSAVLAALLAGALRAENVPQCAASAFCIASGLTVGALCGAGNGLLVTKLRIPPILATLGTMQLYFGAALVVTGGPAVFGLPQAFLFLGNGRLAGIPMPILIFCTVTLFAAFILHRTAFGARLFLIGSNERAARFCGIRIERHLFLTYLLCGILAGSTGLLMAARTNSAKADYGTSYLLQAVLAAILGGVDPAGGRGSVAGVILAVVALQFLASGLNMLRVSMYASEAAWGALLLVVMALGVLARRRTERASA